MRGLVALAATATAVAAAATAAAATAAVATTAAAATAAAAAVAATATTAATTATGSVFAGLGFVNGQCATVDFLAVEGGDDGLGLFIASHLDEPEALAAAGFP